MHGIRRQGKVPSLCLLLVGQSSAETLRPVTRPGQNAQLIKLGLGRKDNMSCCCDLMVDGMARGRSSS
eukprot:640634-Pelagomonas_calceolata.AAC.1